MFVTNDKTAGQDMSEKPLDSQTVFKGKLLHVKSDRVRLMNGHESTREYIVHPGASMIIAQPDETTITLIRQYRYPLDRHFIEVPAGKIDPGEDPLDTAKRELFEECGYSASEWRHLTTLHPGIGYSNERIDLYLASGLSQGAPRLDAATMQHMRSVIGGFAAILAQGQATGQFRAIHPVLAYESIVGPLIINAARERVAVAQELNARECCVNSLPEFVILCPNFENRVNVAARVEHPVGFCNGRFVSRQYRRANRVARTDIEHIFKTCVLRF